MLVIPLIPRFPRGPLLIMLPTVPVKLLRRPPETAANGRLTTPMALMPLLPTARRMLTELLLIGLHRLPTEQPLLPQPLALPPLDAAADGLPRDESELELLESLELPDRDRDRLLRDPLALFEPLVHVLLTGAVLDLLYLVSSVLVMISLVVVNAVDPPNTPPLATPMSSKFFLDEGGR